MRRPFAETLGGSHCISRFTAELSGINIGVRAEEPPGQPPDARIALPAWAEAFSDPMALLLAVRDGHGKVVDFIYRDLNRAAREDITTRSGKFGDGKYLLGRRVLEVLPEFASEGLLGRYAQCLDSGAALLAEDVPYLYFGQPRRFDIHATPAGGADLLVVSWHEVTQRFESVQRILEAEWQNHMLAVQLASDLASASHYVTSILPGDLDGPVKVTSRYLPSHEVGGDCYNYAWRDADHLIFYLIDVSGHGVESALLSVSVHNILRSGTLRTEASLEPHQVLTELNERFSMEHHDGKYFTIWYGIYQRSTRTLRYASAGHPSALAFTTEGGAVAATPLSTPAAPVGMFQDTVYTTGTYAVPVGAQLLLYTDGVFVRPADGDTPWSMPEIMTLCTELAARPGWSLDALVEHLHHHSATGHLDDDCSLVLLTFD